jgi:O-antigen/teichoic acid export membrane protein
MERELKMNRTRLGMKVTFITLLSTLMMGAIVLTRVKIILENYGAELNGLMQVAVQMSAYLVLIESGMTAAYQYNMYSKIKDQNIEKISKLYSGLMKNMKSIGMKMALVCGVFPFVYSLFLNRIEISYIESVFVLLVMGLRFTIPYLLVVPQMGLLAAYERQYVVDIIQLLMNFVVIIIEVIVIYMLKPPLYQVLMIYILCVILTVPIYNFLVVKITKIIITKETIPDMSPKNMTSEILVHQVSSIVFYNTDNILLSIFQTLEKVTIYSAYNTLISYPTQFISKIIGGLRASLAIKIQGKDDNAYDVYNEMLSIVSFCASIVLPLFILMSNKFVSLWIGKEYILENVAVILLGLIILNRMITPVVFAARDAKGLYKESKKYTILQTISNIVVSLILVKPYGITGILIGTLVSTYLIATPFNIFLVNKEVFKKKSNLISRYIKIIIILVIVIGIAKVSNNLFVFDSVVNWKWFILESVYLGTISLGLSWSLFFYTDKYFIKFLKRFIKFKNVKLTN